MSAERWIKISKTLPSDSRFTRMVSALMNERGIVRREATIAQYQSFVAQLMGAMTLLWIHADSHVREDNVLDLTMDEVNDLVGVPEFSKVCSSDWLLETDDGLVIIPEYTEKNPTAVKKAPMSNAERQRRFKERQRLKGASNVANVSNAGNVTAVSGNGARYKAGFEPECNRNVTGSTVAEAAIDAPVSDCFTKEVTEVTQPLPEVTEVTLDKTRGDETRGDETREEVLEQLTNYTPDSIFGKNRAVGVHVAAKSAPVSGEILELGMDMPTPARRDVAAAVFDHWRQEHGHHGSKLTAKRRKIINAALKDYSEDDLCRSISGYRNSPHHMGQNDRQTVYDSIELFLRDAEHIDAGIKHAERPAPSRYSRSTQEMIDRTDGWVPAEYRNEEHPHG